MMIYNCWAILKPTTKKKMNKFLITFSAVLSSFFILSSCCPTKVVTCPDGRPVTYQKNIKCAQNAYKDAVKDFDFNFKATVDVVKQVNIGDASIDVKNKSVLLKDKLNQESSRHQDALKASYLALGTDPCNNSKRHYKLVESITQRNYQLMELKTNIEKSKNDSELNKTLTNYLYERGKKEGTAMGKLSKSLDKFYMDNSKYPETLNELNISEIILTLGSSRLYFKKKDDKNYILKFAGEDYALGTSDDRIYKGIEGKTTKQ
jgi:hypothetical protein